MPTRDSEPRDKSSLHQESLIETLADQVSPGELSYTLILFNMVHTWQLRTSGSHLTHQPISAEMPGEAIF